MYIYIVYMYIYIDTHIVTSISMAQGEAAAVEAVPAPLALLAVPWKLPVIFFGGRLLEICGVKIEIS